MILNLVLFVVFLKVAGFVFRTGFKVAGFLLTGWLVLMGMAMMFRLFGGLFMMPWWFF